jgi:coenzyme F420 hydrogenase subunit beta
VLVFGKKPENLLVGNYVDSYAGFATDLKLRYKASSGGLITALASFALKNGIINGVLMTKMNPEKPLKPMPFIAESEKDIISATGSKFCPVPANLAIKEILRKEGNYIVVGLPCHILGIRKAQLFNKKLRDRISYCFGLVCNHTPSFHATKFLLKKLKISEDRVAELNYRGMGWPGGMSILLDDGSKIFVPLNNIFYWGLTFNRFFWPSRCIICEDKLCNFADISFMDAWLPEFSSDKIGTSLIVVRSEKGRDLLIRAMKHGIIKLERVGIEKIMAAQEMRIEARKKSAIKLISRLLFHKTILSNKFTFKPKFLDILNALHFILTNELCENNSWFSQQLIDSHIAIWNVINSIKKLRHSNKSASLKDLTRKDH